MSLTLIRILKMECKRQVKPDLTQQHPFLHSRHLFTEEKFNKLNPAIAERVKHGGLN